MRVIYKEPDKYPETIEIGNDLPTLQKLVGGPIEAVTFASNACVICNEEGRLRGLPYNITFLGIHFVGPILVVGADGEDFCDLEDIDWLMDTIRHHMLQAEQRHG